MGGGDEILRTRSVLAAKTLLGEDFMDPEKLRFTDLLMQRVGMMQRDLEVLKKRMGSSLPIAGLSKVPLHADPDDFSEDEWKALMEVEKVREDIFSLCMIHLVGRG